jgi:hypothetical protein
MTTCGSDEQEPDTRLRALGKLAMDSDTRYSLVGERSKSGAAGTKQTCLTLGDLIFCRDRLSRRQRGEMEDEESAEARPNPQSKAGVDPRWTCSGRIER